MNNSSASTNSLQPNGGGLQLGRTNLQPQSAEASNGQSTGSLQQDVLGPEAFQNFEGLSVQGSTGISQTKTATTGEGTPEIFFGVFFVLLIGAVIVFRRYKKLLQIQQPQKAELAMSAVSSNASEAAHESAVTTTKKTPVKKSKAVSKKPLKKKSKAAKKRKK